MPQAKQTEQCFLAREKSAALRKSSSSSSFAILDRCRLKRPARQGKTSERRTPRIWDVGFSGRIRGRKTIRTARLGTGHPSTTLHYEHHGDILRIVRTTVMIEDDVYATAKQIAQSSGRTLGEVISQLVRQGLAAEPSFDIKNGIPVFRIANSAERIPGSRAAEILDQGD